MMKKIPFLFIFLLLSGCGAVSQALQNFKPPSLSNSPSSTASPSGGCSDKPTGVLKKPKPIDLSSQSVTESGQISVTNAAGFVFEGKAGEDLSYSTKNDLCLWVIQPNNQPLNGTKLPEDGKYTIQVTSKQGSGTFNLEMSLGTLQGAVNPQSSQQQITINHQYQSPNNPPSNSQSSFSSSSSSLSQQQAVDLVANWYKAKPQIFGQSFDENLVNQYATGTLYYETLQKDGGGGVGWLKRNGCYYTFDYTTIQRVISFSSSSSQPYLTIRVSERLQLNGPSSAGCGNSPKTYTKNATYWFAQENGVWKIERYKVGT